MKVFLGSLITYLYNDFVSHLPIHSFRLGFLRLINNKIHPTAKILMHVRLLGLWNIRIGKNVIINQHCVLDGRKYPVSIGENTDIGPYTRIWTLGHDPDDESHGLYGAEVTIGHHVWVAAGVTVLPGVELSDGCVVGAGSVVLRSVGPKKIVAGNPARVVRDRNNNLNYRIKYRPILE